MVRRVLLRLFPVSSSAALMRLCALAVLSLGVVWALPVGASAANYEPVAEYSFDEDPLESTTIEDQSGNGHTATIVGAEWNEHGRYGGAMEFEASKGDELTIPASEDFEVEEFTLEGWVRPEEARELAPVVANTTTGPGAGPGYALFAGGDGGKHGHPEAFTTEGDEIAASADQEAPLPNHAWTHLAATYDGSVVRLYVDGVLVDTSAADPVAKLGEGSLQIGGDEPWDEGGFFDGRIDELRIYDRALNAGEVAADMETPIATPKSGPVAEWSFDGVEEGATTIEDQSGNGHTATIHGAKWSPHGRYGGAMELAGEEGEYLTVPESSDLDLTEGFTLEAWVRPEEGDNHWSPLIGKEIPGEEGLTDYAYYLYEGDWEENRPGGSVLEGEYLHAGASLPIHAWSQVTLTFDGHTERLYVDGQLVDEGTGEAPPITEGELQIGGSSEQGNSLDGRIDEVRIYGRGLNQAEVDADVETPIRTPKSGPLAAYAFDEGEEAGETVDDVSGNNHPATIEDGIRTKGRYGGAVEFDGLGGTECVTVPDALDLRVSEEFTLEAWVRPDNGVYGDPVVVKESGGKNAFGLGLGLGSEGTETAGGFIGHGKGTETAGGGIVHEKTWSHVATTYDGSEIRVYVDGELVDTEEASTPPLAGEGNLKIGCDGPDGQFTGRIDEVRFYGRALNPGEVAYDMEAPLLTPKATPVADYSFDEENEETQADTSGDGHTATVEGAEWTEHGRYGGAMEFDASKEDVLKIPASADLNFKEEFTLEAWVRPSGQTNEYAPLIDKQEGGGLGYFLYEGGSEPDVPVGAADPGHEHVHAHEPLPADTWSHVALVFVGNRTFLYVNGEEVQNGAALPLLGEEGELEIGGSTDTADYFDGRIDEVRVYNRGLDEAEVSADMENPIQTPRQGPVAAFGFDEGEGTAAQDASGGENAATIEGPSWANGRYGEALHFDGEDDCVSIAESDDLRFDEEFTLEAWVRPDVGSPAQEPIIVQEDGAVAEGEEPYAYALVGGGEASAAGWMRIAGEHEYEGIYGDGPLPENVWTHIALTDDGSQLRLYENGKLVREIAAPVLTTAHGQISIGCDKTFGSYFEGRIDEIHLYDRALSGSEVQASLAPMPYVLTAEPFGVEDGNAVLTGMINPGGEDVRYRFEYGETPSLGESAPEDDRFSEETIGGDEPREVSELAEGLKENTTYYVRIDVSNGRETIVGRTQLLKTPTEATPRAKLAEERLELRANKPGSGFFDMNWNGNPGKTANEETAKMVKASGAKMFRVSVGNTDTSTDELFLHAAQRGITILPDLAGVPDAPHDKLIPSMAEGMGYRKKWEGKLSKFVERYGVGGSFWSEHTAFKEMGYEPEWWEVWNEPNFGPSGTEGPNGEGEANPVQFGEFLQISHDAITSINPEAKVLVGGLLSVGETGALPHMQVQEFLRRMKHESAYNAIGLHPYAFDGLQSGAVLPKHETPFGHVTKLIRRNIIKARSALNRVNEGSSKKIWVTEIGVPVHGNGYQEDGLHRAVDEELQRQVLNSVFGMLKEYSASAPGSAGIRNAFYYNIQDNTESGSVKWENHCGLRKDSDGLGEHGEYREAWQSFQTQAEAPNIGAEP
jgi:hypothetical protein